MRGLEEPPVDQLIGDYKSPYEVAHGVASILPEDEKRLPYTEKPPLNMVYADLSRGLDESGNIMNPATMEMTDVGMEFADQKFLELMARCDGDFDRARKILGAVENNYTRLDTPHKSAQFNALTRSIQAKISYNAHLMYAYRKYGFDQPGQNVYEFLQDKRIAPEDEIYSRASEVLQEKVELYKLAMEKRMGFLNKQNAALVEETGKSPGVLEKVRRFAEKFTPTKDILAHGALVLSFIVASGLAYQHRDGISNYADTVSNAAIQTILGMQRSSIFHDTSSHENLDADLSQTQESAASHIDLDTFNPTAQEWSQDKTEALVRETYSRRLHELISSGCYDVKPYLAQSGDMTLQISSNPHIIARKLRVIDSLVPGDRYNSEVCESKIRYPNYVFPEGFWYYYDSRVGSQFDGENHSIAYSVSSGGEINAYPLQIGSTCYIDTFSIALADLASREGLLPGGFPIDPQLFMDMMPYHTNDLVDYIGPSDYNPLDTFSKAIQRSSAVQARFDEMMKAYWGLNTVRIRLYETDENDYRKYRSNNDLIPFTDNFIAENEIGVSDNSDGVKSFENVLEQIYRNPKNVGMSLGIGLDTNRKDPTVKGSYNGSHAFYIQELINNADWKNGSDQPQYYIRVLEGNGGGAVGFDLIDKIYTTALSDGSIILPVDASLIDLLHSDINIYQFDSSRFSMSIDQVKHEAGVHAIVAAPDDALVPDQN